jgi:hypothetical protein
MFAQRFSGQTLLCDSKMLHRLGGMHGSLDRLARSIAGRYIAISDLRISKMLQDHTVEFDAGYW